MIGFEGEPLAVSQHKFKVKVKVGQAVPDVFLRSQLSLMPELKNGFAFVGLKFVSCLRSSGFHLIGQCQAQPDLRTALGFKTKKRSGLKGASGSLTTLIRLGATYSPIILTTALSKIVQCFVVP